MAKRKAFVEEEMPTGDQAADRWKCFCARLDTLDASVVALDTSVAQVLELGQLILLALHDAVAAGVPPSTLLGLIEKVLTKTQEAREYYGGRR